MDQFRETRLAYRRQFRRSANADLGPGASSSKCRPPTLLAQFGREFPAGDENVPGAVRPLRTLFATETRSRKTDFEQRIQCIVFGKMIARTHEKRGRRAGEVSFPRRKDAFVESNEQRVQDGGCSHSAIRREKYQRSFGQHAFRCSWSNSPIGEVFECRTARIVRWGSVKSR